MANEREKDPRNNGPIFYSGDNIVVAESPTSMGDYDLFVGKQGDCFHTYLQHGVMEELATVEEASQFSSRLCAVDPVFVNMLSRRDIPVERIAWALARARISYLEEELRDAHEHISDRATAGDGE